MICMHIQYRVVLNVAGLATFAKKSKWTNKETAHLGLKHPPTIWLLFLLRWLPNYISRNDNLKNVCSENTFKTESREILRKIFLVVGLRTINEIHSVCIRTSCVDYVLSFWTAPTLQSEFQSILGGHNGSETNKYVHHYQRSVTINVQISTVTLVIYSLHSRWYVIYIYLLTIIYIYYIYTSKYASQYYACIYGRKAYLHWDVQKKYFTQFGMMAYCLRYGNLGLGVGGGELIRCVWHYK